MSYALITELQTKAIPVQQSCRVLSASRAGYYSKQYQAFLTEQGFICSMSRRANCWDNAVAERFFLNLKMERVWQRTYANQAEAKNNVTDYIAGFYNCTRLHSVLGNLSPSAFERKMAAKKPIAVSEFS